MIRVYKTKDRIPVKIGQLKLKIAPLSFAQKLEIAAQTKMSGGVEVSDGLKMTGLTIKYCVKDVQGLQNQDGSDYELKFDDNGMLSDECVDDILNLEESTPILQVCSSLVNGIKDPKIKGVVFDLDHTDSVKKK